MKYTIELTNKQKAQMDCIIEIVHRYVGFNPKLEPSENLWESELEKHRKQAYDKGSEDARQTIWCMLTSPDSVFDVFPEFSKLSDIIANMRIQEINARIKAYEEKKKAMEEIKVGDEVKDLSSNKIGVVVSVGQMIVYMTELSHIYSNTRGSLEKTGRHFGKEIEQLLGKLKERE